MKEINKDDLLHVFMSRQKEQKMKHMCTVCNIFIPDTFGYCPICGKCLLDIGLIHSGAIDKNELVNRVNNNL